MRRGNSASGSCMRVGRQQVQLVILTERGYTKRAKGDHGLFVRLASTGCSFVPCMLGAVGSVTF